MMIDPMMALLSAGAILLVVFLTFWPEKGLLAKLRLSKYTIKRVLLEDALKHIYNCEEENITCTFHSLASTLTREESQLNPIIKRLESFGLLNISGQGFQLTAQGKNYAMRVVRTHRLWERYLAEETSVPETSWHEQADLKEHIFTEEDTNRISKQLGYPRYDPHGDPIPTASGDLPPQRGRQLNDFSEGDIVKVIKIEDKPPSAYAEIIAKGIHLDIQIEILKKVNNNIHLLVNGQAQTFPLALTKNITAETAVEDVKILEPQQSLSSLNIGEKGEVLGISRACRGAQRRRLMDLGIVPGTVISTAMESASGDPKAYTIRGAMIALRKDQADFIQIQPLNKVSTDDV
jgi:DtxR family transcriptional regulator, Mn-dependent transcriptional regulator